MDFYKTVTSTILQMGGGHGGAHREENYRQEEGNVSFTSSEELYIILTAPRGHL